MSWTIGHFYNYIYNINGFPTASPKCFLPVHGGCGDVTLLEHSFVCHGEPLPCPKSTLVLRRLQCREVLMM